MLLPILEYGDILVYKSMLLPILEYGDILVYKSMLLPILEYGDILVYKSMLLPILEYGDILLNAASAQNRKKTLQNKGLRCALNKRIETSRACLHAEAGLLRLNFRREQHLLNFMYDWSQNPKFLSKKHSEAMQTRSHTKKLLKIKKPNTEKFKKSLAY